MSEIRLTQYASGSGCGCKMSTAQLEQILHMNSEKRKDPLLWVGNDSKDDAAVYDLRDGTAVVSTVDFFTPIVDDPFCYGGISSANAISDIYAMGAKPLVAIAILGWPVNKIPLSVAKKVLEGSHDVCSKANIVVAGGHSIDSPEPIFGLAVTGRVVRNKLKRNNTAQAGSIIYLTKPLGVGIIATAQKKGHVQKEHLQQAVKSMMTLNRYGAEWGDIPYITAMTDVSGFGLLGHLIELCEGSNLSAEIEFDSIPVFDFLQEYLTDENLSGGLHRNWKSYAHKVNMKKSDTQKWILSDPQTSGGLLVCVRSEYAEQFEHTAAKVQLALNPFGRLVEKQSAVVTVW